MTHSSTRPGALGFAFAGLVAIVYAASMTLALPLPSLEHPGVVALGIRPGPEPGGRGPR